MKGSSIIKLLFGACILCLAGMLYWSSLLQEEDLKRIRQDIKELRVENALLSQKLSKANFSAGKANETISTRPDARYPNLLEEDPYFSQTLPKMVGEDFRPQGILRKSLIGKPENLHPFNGFRDVIDLIDACSVRVADLKTGYYETMSPCMAYKVEVRPHPEKPDTQEYWVFLRDDVYWQPLSPSLFPSTFDLAPQFLEKQPVTAHDFKFYFDAIMNPFVHEAKAVSVRTYLSDIEEFNVIDDYTFVVRWKTYPTEDETGKKVNKVKYTSLGLTGSLQPLPRFVYQYFADGQKIIDEDSAPDTYRKNSVWAQNFAHHWAKNVIVSCGPYLFNGMTDEGISLIRNPYHYNPYAVLVEGIKYTFKESFDAVWQDFKSGQLDMCTLSPSQMVEIDHFLASPEYKLQEKNHHAIRSLDYVDLSYFYIGWNQAKPFFDTLAVRKAMTLAIDRGRIIEQNLNLMAVPITGPFFRFSPANDPSVTPYSYNPEEASRLLDEAGWIDLDGDGIRDKIIDGKKVPFRFKMCYYIKSLATKVVAEYIMTALRDVGIQCELFGVDIADLSRQFEDKNFDAIFMGWKLGTPPEDPRQLWHSSGAKEKGSSNAIGFCNSEIDRLIERLSYEYDKTKRTELYHLFHQIIHSQAPYTFLYTPKVRLLYREHVQNIFIPREKQDIIPNADIPEPVLQSVWLQQPGIRK